MNLVDNFEILWWSGQRQRAQPLAILILVDWVIHVWLSESGILLVN